MKHIIKDKKKPTTVTLSESLLKEAKELGVNISQFSEDGLRAGVKALKEKQWKEENREAIEAYNKEIQANGFALQNYRVRDFGDGAV